MKGKRYSGRLNHEDDEGKEGMEEEISRITAHQDRIHLGQNETEQCRGI